jgi:hypothetical protein
MERGWVVVVVVLTEPTPAKSSSRAVASEDVVHSYQMDLVLSSLLHLDKMWCPGFPNVSEKSHTKACTLATSSHQSWPADRRGAALTPIKLVGSQIDGLLGCGIGTTLRPISQSINLLIHDQMVVLHIQPMPSLWLHLSLLHACSHAHVCVESSSVL